MTKLGVIGYGYWGPNIVRNFLGHQDCKVVAVCDKNPAALARVLGRHAGVRVTTDVDDIVTSSEIDAVAIVTPVSYHYELAKKALENGKHVFVEKPFTANSAQAEDLIELAERKNLQIMVDHTFLFTGAVRKIKQLVVEGSLGPLYYYDSTESVRLSNLLVGTQVHTAAILAPDVLTSAMESVESRLSDWERQTGSFHVSLLPWKVSLTVISCNA